MNWQNGEFKTVIKNCKIFNACAAIDYQPTVHNESQKVPGIKIESYILAPFSSILTCSGGYHAKKFNIVNIFLKVLNLKFRKKNCLHVSIVNKGAKIRNRYNQVPHLTQDTNGKLINSQFGTTNESQEVSPFPAGDHFLIKTMVKN